MVGLLFPGMRCCRRLLGHGAVSSTPTEPACGLHWCYAEQTFRGQGVHNQAQTFTEALLWELEVLPVFIIAEHNLNLRDADDKNEIAEILGQGSKEKRQKRTNC